MRRRNPRLIRICAAVCAVTLVINGVGIWMSETALWLPLIGATTALVGIAVWAYTPETCRTDKEDPS